MLHRPTLTKTRATKESSPEPMVSGQAKPSLQRFHLKVDGQTKSSFSTLKGAEKVGLEIKKAHPMVQCVFVRRRANGDWHARIAD
jgi:hypothetical protein